MTSTFEDLSKKGLINTADTFLKNAIQYEVIMGSMAYGVSNDSSDIDVYGFAISPKYIQFPHVRGEISGFDDIGPQFEQFQQHHIVDQSANAGKGKIIDITIYSITKYFRLLVDNNPNIIDTLFVPRNCILYSTKIGELIRENRKLFLHKGCWPKFKGYAYSQIHKMKTKNPIGKRKEIIDNNGYDIKFAYHVVRLLNEVEQLLIEQDLDLTRNKEQLKSIRRGEWSLDKIEQYFFDKEKELEKCYLTSSLPQTANLDKIKKLLLECMSLHYGHIEDVIVSQNQYENALRDIKEIVDKLNIG